MKLPEFRSSVMRLSLSPIYLYIYIYLSHALPLAACWHCVQAATQVGEEILA